MAGVVEQLEQVESEQRSGVGEVVPRGQLFFEGRAQQVQHQVDAGPPFGHVVLQIAEESLVAQVDLGRQADEQHVQLEVREPEEPLQLVQPQGHTPLPAGLFLASHFVFGAAAGSLDLRLAERQIRRGPVRQARRLAEQRVDFLFGNDETLELFVGDVEQACPVHLKLDEKVDAFQFCQDMLERRSVVVHVNSLEPLGATDMSESLVESVVANTHDRTTGADTWCPQSGDKRRYAPDLARCSEQFSGFEAIP